MLPLQSYYFSTSYSIDTKCIKILLKPRVANTYTFCIFLQNVAPTKSATVPSIAWLKYQNIRNWLSNKVLNKTITLPVNPPILKLEPSPGCRWIYDWWSHIGFYIIGATFKVARCGAASNFGQDNLFSFCQPAHNL